MARPYFTAKHVESMALLPDNLKIGRAYFVDDEQVIVIDHGRGPVIYGKSPGPQGIAGEPIPQLQDQIDALAEAELTTQRTLWDINEREISRHEDLDAKIAANLEHSASETAKCFSFAEELSAHNAEAIASLIDTMHTQFQKYDSALNILARSIAELYPDIHSSTEDPYEDPLDNETIYTDAGAYTIQQTTLKDGTIILNLTPQEQIVDTLKAGDSVDFDGSTWLVEDISTSGGTTTITIRP